MDEKLESIEKNLQKINRNLSSLHTIKRGLINGIASGIGATIGLALVLYILVRILSSLDYVPFINNLLEITKLDELIENQIATDNNVIN